MCVWVHPYCVSDTMGMGALTNTPLTGTGAARESFPLARLSSLTRSSKLAQLPENFTTAMRSHARLHVSAWQRCPPPSTPVHWPRDLARPLLGNSREFLTGTFPMYR